MGIPAPQSKLQSGLSSRYSTEIRPSRLPGKISPTLGAQVSLSIRNYAGILRYRYGCHALIRRPLSSHRRQRCLSMRSASAASLQHSGVSPPRASTCFSTASTIDWPPYSWTGHAPTRRQRLSFRSTQASPRELRRRLACGGSLRADRVAVDPIVLPRTNAEGSRLRCRRWMVISPAQHIERSRGLCSVQRAFRLGRPGRHTMSGTAAFVW